MDATIGYESARAERDAARRPPHEEVAVTPSKKPADEAKGPGRYEALTRYLKEVDGTSVTLTFDRLSEILGFPLPAAASNHAQWWEEGSSHPQARGWRDAGWSFVRTDRRDQSVTFRKDASVARARRGASAARTKTRTTAKKSASAAAASGDAGRAAKRRLATALILLPDSAVKRAGGDPAWRRQVTAPVVLGEAGGQLAADRRALAELVGEAAGPDLGGDGLRRAYLPALERFAGGLYDAAEVTFWSAEDRETLRGCGLIVSALYGLVTTIEPIRDHALTMASPLPDGRTVNQWWRERALGDLVRAHVADGGVTDVYSFLPADHIDAIGGLEIGGATVHRIAAEPAGDAASRQGDVLTRLIKEGACDCPECCAGRP
jgi:hypothetical protein